MGAVTDRNTPGCNAVPTVGDIWDAIAKKEGERVKAILSTNDIKSSDLVNSKGQSILHAAAISGSEEIVSIILESHIPTLVPDILDNSLATPLHLAIKGNHLSVVKTLIRFGADVNIEDEAGETPMLLCALHGRKEVGLFLLESNEGGIFPEPLNINTKGRE